MRGAARTRTHAAHSHALTRAHTHARARAHTDQFGDMRASIDATCAQSSRRAIQPTALVAGPPVRVRCASSTQVRCARACTLAVQHHCSSSVL
eukprot:6199813-Pleurochrysis_carterae.AAC.3